MMKFFYNVRSTWTTTHTALGTPLLGGLTYRPSTIYSATFKHSSAFRHLMVNFNLVAVTYVQYLFYYFNPLSFTPHHITSHHITSYYFRQKLSVRFNFNLKASLDLALPCLVYFSIFLMSYLISFHLYILLYLLTNVYATRL